MITIAASESFLHAEPQLFVTDLRRSVSFYVDKLGFTIAFSYGLPARYAQVIRGGARLNLRQADRRPFDAEFCRTERDVLSATIAVASAQPVFEEISARGVKLHQPLVTENWGTQTFIIRDPDGNLVCFAGS